MKKVLIFISAILLNANNFDEAKQAYIHMDYSKAYKLFMQECNNKNAKACNYIGVLYEKGLGVKANTKTALEFYKKGCESYSEACVNLGSLQLQLENKKEANKAFNKACEMGYKMACSLIKKD